ncbi:MAG: hypothetical protein ABL949_01855 [Fimbriimonadaceae bacterium]
MIIKILAFCSLIALLGCGKSAGVPESSTKASPSPEQLVYEQLRSGSIQLDAASQILAEALEVANSKTMPKDEALGELRDLVDGAGASIADFVEPPKDLQEVQAKFAEFDDTRLKSVEAANDAIHATADALEIAEVLREDPANEKNADLHDLADLLAEAKQNLRDAIITLGGKVEVDASQ